MRKQLTVRETRMLRQWANGEIDMLDMSGDADIMEREIADYIPEISGHSTIVDTEPIVFDDRKVI